MKKYLILLLALAAFPAWGQYTQVSATITGSNGVPYANGTYNISLVSSTGQDISTSPVYIGSIPFTVSPVAGNMDSTGSFSVQVLANTAFTAPASPNPNGTQYNFSICSQSPAGNPGSQIPPQRCFSGIFTVTGTTLSLTTQLSALAPPLGSGGGSVTGAVLLNPLGAQTVIQPVASGAQTFLNANAEDGWLNEYTFPGTTTAAKTQNAINDLTTVTGTDSSTAQVGPIIIPPYETPYNQTTNPMLNTNDQGPDNEGAYVQDFRATVLSGWPASGSLVSHGDDLCASNYFYFPRSQIIGFCNYAHLSNYPNNTNGFGGGGFQLWMDGIGKTGSVQANDGGAMLTITLPGFDSMTNRAATTGGEFESIFQGTANGGNAEGAHENIYEARNTTWNSGSIDAPLYSHMSIGAVFQATSQAFTTPLQASSPWHIGLYEGIRAEPPNVLQSKMVLSGVGAFTNGSSSVTTYKSWCDVINVTHYSASGSTLTLTVPNSLAAGDEIIIRALPTDPLAALNNVRLIVLPTGLSGSQVEVTTSAITGSGSTTATTNAGDNDCFVDSAMVNQPILVCPTAGTDCNGIGGVNYTVQLSNTSTTATVISATGGTYAGTTGNHYWYFYGNQYSLVAGQGFWATAVGSAFPTILDTRGGAGILLDTAVSDCVGGVPIACKINIRNSNQANLMSDGTYYRMALDVDNGGDLAFYSPCTVTMTSSLATTGGVTTMTVTATGGTCTTPAGTGGPIQLGQLVGPAGTTYGANPYGVVTQFGTGTGGTGTYTLGNVTPAGAATVASSSMVGYGDNAIALLSAGPTSTLTLTGGVNAQGAASIFSAVTATASLVSQGTTNLQGATNIYAGNSTYYFSPTFSGTANRVLTIPDANTNTIVPLGSPTTGDCVQYIDAGGVQHLTTCSGGSGGLPSGTGIVAVNSGTGALATEANLLPIAPGAPIGMYSSGTTYKLGDFVWDGSNNYYQSLVSSNTGNALPVLPTAATSYWRFVAPNAIASPDGISIQSVAGIISTTDCGPGATFVNQCNPNFTTASALTTTATMNSTDTTITFASTTGFPAIGCGIVNGSAQDAVCWTGKNSTTLQGVTHGYYGTTASTVNSGAGVYGIVENRAATAHSIPIFTLTNNNTVAFANGTAFTDTNSNAVKIGQFGNTNYSGTNLALYQNISKLGNTNTAGNFGVPIVVNSPSRLTGQTASIGATNIQCNGGICPVGLYRITYSGTITTAGTAGDTLTLKCTSTDDSSTANTQSSSAFSASAIGAFSYSCTVYTTGAANIQAAATLSSTAGSPAYSLSYYMEQLQ